MEFFLCELRDLCGENTDDPKEPQTLTALLNIAVSNLTEFFKSFKSTISEAEWTYLHGIDKTPAITPARVIWIARASVPPSNNTSRW